MPNPFPGMNPYLEHPQLWSGAHSSLIVYLADRLNPALRSRYVAAVEVREYVEPAEFDAGLIERHRPRRQHQLLNSAFLCDRKGGRIGGRVDDFTALAESTTPVDDEPFVIESSKLRIRETYIEILDLHSDRRLVTVIELVSPTNKAHGPGRDSYLEKQYETLKSTVNLVEVDLLRFGRHVIAVPEELARRRSRYDYLVSVNRAGARERFEIYPRLLRQRLPRIRIPLAGDDPDVRLDLQAEVDRLCDLGRYEDRVDYRRPCDPPLPDEDQTWAFEQITASGVLG